MANFFSDNKNLLFHLQNADMERIVNLKERNFLDAESYVEAPASYEEAMENYKLVLEIVGEIAADLIAPNAESVDAEGPKVVNNEIHYASGTLQNHNALRDAGLYGMALPRKYNGLNFPYLPYVMAAEIISRADAGFANIWGLQDCASTICEFGSEEQKEQFLPRIHAGATCSMDLTEPDAGSDLQSVRLKATFDEEANCWRLNGVKRFITNGDADIKLVLARSEEGTDDARGLSCFLYDRKSNAVKIRRIENKLGIKGSPTAEIVFDNAPAQLVGNRRFGLIKYVMSLMNGARLGVGAQSVGLAEAAYQEALSYAKQRKQFGNAIISFPQVYEMIALMRAKIDAIRTLLYETTRFVDHYKALENIAKERSLTVEEKTELKENQKCADFYTPLLKLISSEYANQIAYDSIQVHGGSGYMKEYACERLYRDARILSIYEGTSQLQVVAAIRGVTNGFFLQKIENYLSKPISAELQDLREQMLVMKQYYAEMCATAEQFSDKPTSFDLNARKLVESSAILIMCSLLLLDANQDNTYLHSCKLMIHWGMAEMLKNRTSINRFTPELKNDLLANLR
mgnify:FL=1